MANRQRVYATGICSGAMMTSVLLGAYPDVFAAGSVASGVPFGCFATSDGSLWNSACATGRLDRSAEQWAQSVLDASPDHHGPRPRVQSWHGTEDEVLSYVNLTEAVEPWSTVLGAGPEPALVDRPQDRWEHHAWTDRSGRVVLDVHTLEGAAGPRSRARSPDGGRARRSRPRASPPRQRAPVLP